MIKFQYGKARNMYIKLNVESKELLYIDVGRSPYDHPFEPFRGNGAKFPQPCPTTTSVNLRLDTLLTTVLGLLASFFSFFKCRWQPHDSQCLG
jgi:hypothetical protein